VAAIELANQIKVEQLQSGAKKSADAAPRRFLMMPGFGRLEISGVRTVR
jgi:hypothetical protein